jgi:hypothetical protein
MAIPSFWRNNGISLAFGTLSLASLGGHAWAGLHAENAERLTKGSELLDLGSYLTSGVFTSSLFENWESEFLQMAFFVVLTVGLRQRGSSESKPLEEEPKPARQLQEAPWPVRRGGPWLRLYEHSLSLALFALFLVSFVAHWCGSYRHYIDEQLDHGRGPEHGIWGHVVDSRFWFESFQNWQSEFFSVTALVLLSIFLREKDSAQSKDVAAPHGETGD